VTEDTLSIVALRAAVAATLSATYGPGPWARVSTEKGVRFEMRSSKVFVVREKKSLVATLRLNARKPWAIDLRYFTPCTRPLYLLSMAVSPEFQRRGLGRFCIKQIQEIARQWPADAIRLDAFDAPAGAGAFYTKCGFNAVGQTTYRNCPLAYFEMLL
jgi:GNAT superfamily N-acetyltransferase